MRALLVVCRYLGDTLLATPLAKALHQEGYDVDWLVAPHCASMVQGQDFAQTIHVLEPSLAATSQLIKKLYKRYDLAAVINGGDRPMAVALSAAKKTYALLPERWQDGWKRLCSHACIHNRPHTHMVYYTLEMAELMGIKACHDVGIRWHDEDRLIVKQQLPWQNKPYILLHPFARWPYKLWPMQNWRQLIQRLIDHQLAVVLTAGPHDREQAEQLVKDHDAEQLCLLVDTLSWPQLACLSAEASCYIGLDTANTHLAASTNTPIITLFGPTNPELWGPWPNGTSSPSPYQSHELTGQQTVQRIHLLQGQLGCEPCQLEGCQRQQNSQSDCLNSITVDRVWQTLTGIIPEACQGETP